MQHVGCLALRMPILTAQPHWESISGFCLCVPEEVHRTGLNMMVYGAFLSFTTPRTPSVLVNVQRGGTATVATFASGEAIHFVLSCQLWQGQNIYLYLASRPLLYRFPTNNDRDGTSTAVSLFCDSLHTRRGPQVTEHSFAHSSSQSSRDGTNENLRRFQQFGDRH